MRFAIVSSGFTDGPAQALRDFLLNKRAEGFTVQHPLSPEDELRHVISSYTADGSVSLRSVRVPVRPPLSYGVDPIVPLVPPRVDVWFGFNPLACSRGLLARAQGRARFVVLWSVDFVPDRFGAKTLATRLYDRLDRLSCLRAQARVELTETARDARNARHSLPLSAPPSYIVPMGAWLDRLPNTAPDAVKERRVVFLGHLVPRQGVELLLEALAVLKSRGVDFSADIIGTGPLEDPLRDRSRELRLDGVRFHGFVPAHADVERLLARASVAVAPYVPADDSFTRYADPGKLKAYLGAGLPIVLTDVPPNAREMQCEGGARIVRFDATELADAIAATLADPDAWLERRDLALAYARRFDWAVLLGDLFEKLSLSLSEQ